MSDLVAFLTARLDEDEAAARESHYEGQRWLTEEEGVYRWPDDEPVHLADRKADARHIALHDPARVLREVQAKRAMMTDIVGLIDGMDMQIEGEWGTGGTCTTGESDAVLRILAAVYSDHPDYDPAWEPQP